MAIDKEIFRKTKDYSRKLKGESSDRTDAMTSYKKAYELDSPIEEDIKDLGSYVSFVVDPSPRVRMQGAKRLLTATEMVHTIPKKEGMPDVGTVGKMQDMSRTIWWRSGQVAGIPLEEDMVPSSLMYDEVHLQVIKTADIKRHFEQGVKRKQKDDPKYEAPPAAISRIEMLIAQTPYLIEVLDPTMGYPEWDRLGLRRYYSEMKVSAGYLMDVYGIATDDPFATKTLCSMWDLEWRHVWVDEGNDIEKTDLLIVQERHKLPFIPIVCYLAEGSKVLWSNAREQRQPFLYTMLTGGLWKLNTLILSALATKVKVHGIVANFKFTGEGSPEYEVNDFLGVYKVAEDEKLEELNLTNANRALQEMYSLVQDLTTQATIYDQSLGAPGGRGDPYSKTALLHQAGRLPLVTTQRQVANCAASAMLLCFLWMRHDDEAQYSAQGKYGEINIDTDKIPEHLVLESKLEIDLPQDQLQLANVVGALRDIMGDEWVMTNVLSVEEPEKIIEQRTSERFFQTEAELDMQDMSMERQLGWQARQSKQAADIQQQQMIEQQLELDKVEDTMGGPGEGEPSPEEEMALGNALRGGVGMMPPPNQPQVPSPGRPEGA